MEILDTSSKQCKILIKDGKKYVIRYPRKIGATVEYYRSTPENEVLKILQNNNIKAPKVIYEGEKYSIQEYIEGELLSNKYEDHKDIDKNVIDQIIEQICLLSTIPAEELSRYSNWNNNSGFYKFQCDNTQRVYENYHKSLKQIYDSLNLTPNIFENLYSKAPKIHNGREMSIIHGDRHKKNAIINDNNEIVFIDWELGCIGDIAYDIAFHLHQMAYTEDDEKYFLNKLKSQFKGDSEELLKDVELYRLFLLARSTLYHVYWTDLLHKNDCSNDERKKQLGHFMRRYNRLSTYNEFNIQPKSEDEISLIFQEFRKNLSQEQR